MVTGLSKAWLGVNNAAQPIMLGESTTDYGVHLFTVDRQSITTKSTRHKDGYGYPENDDALDETQIKLFYFNNSDILKYNKLSVIANISDVSYTTIGNFYSNTYYIKIIPPLSLERENSKATDLFTIPLTRDGTQIDSSKPYPTSIKWSLYRRIDDYGDSLGSYDPVVSLAVSLPLIRSISTINSSQTYTVTVSGLHIEVYGYI